MRALIGAVVAAVAVVLQLAVVDRIAFPGGTQPDLVLLTVAALALAIGPMTGAFLGFCAGLALDVAPPAGHLVGQDALVFCLIGYVCGLVAATPTAEGLPDQEHSALFELGATAAGALCGEAMIAGLGVMLSDPRVSWPAIKHVLPVAAGYDVLLSPFVLFTVAAMLRVAGLVSPREAGPAIAARPAAWAGGAAASGAVRQLAGSGPPRLRLSGQGSGDGWVGGGRGGGGANRGPGRSGPGNSRPGAGRRDPRIKLGGSATALRPGGGRPGQGPRSGRVRFAGRRGEGVVGGSLLGSAGGSGLSRAIGFRSVGFRRAGDKLAGSRFGVSLLGGSVFGRSSSAFGRPMSAFGRSSAGFSGSSALSGRSGQASRGGLGSSGFSGRSLRTLSKGSAGKGGIARGPGGGGHAPRFRRDSALSRMASGGQRSGQRKAPGKGWLRGSRPGRGPVRSLAGNSLSRRSPGRGWLRGSSGGLGRGLGGGKASGLGGKSSGLGGKSSGLRGGIFRRSSGLGGRSGLGGGGLGGGGASLGGGGLGAKSRFGGGLFRIGKNPFGNKNRLSGGPSRIGIGRTKKSWRRTGGYR